MADDLLPPEDPKLAIMHMWPRLRDVEKSQVRLEIALNNVRQDVKEWLDRVDSGMTKHFSEVDEHLSQQDIKFYQAFEKMAALSVEQAENKSRWPDGAKVFARIAAAIITAIVGGFIEFLIRWR